MKYTLLRPMLWTRDLHETIAFYTQKLGFTCGESSDEWASLHKDDAALMIAKPNAHTPFDGPKFTGSFYINTDEVDAVWAKLKDEVAVAYGIENFEYGMREFAIYDNNGYLIQFGQEIG